MTHMQLGGGINNAMRALGYRITGPSDPADCTAFEVHCPDGVTVLLAKDEFEGWQKADEHWRGSALAKVQIKRPMPTNPDLAALSAAAKLRDLIADTAADLSNGNPFWTAGQLADALLATGNLVQIDREGMRERVGVALCQNALGGKQCPCAEKGVFSCADAYPGYQADAAIAAILGGEHDQ